MSEFKKLEYLLENMDYIEGNAEGGRYFKMEYNAEIFKIQIFDSGCVYESSLCVSEVIGNNILSKINKIESDFFKSGQRAITRTKRKEIHIVGVKEKEMFTIDLSVNDNWTTGNLYYRGSFTSLTMHNNVPDHIHADQRHDWLYLHYQKPENWTSILEFDFKDNWYRCCGEDIKGKYNYCHHCGKAQIVDGLVITEIIGKELLTKLT